MIHKKRKLGFTLVEALIALSVLLIGIISGFILVTRALYNARIIQDRLTASFLAQEGIELVRHLRDTNYVKNLSESPTSWNAGLNDDINCVKNRIGVYIISVNSGSVDLKCITGGLDIDVPYLKEGDIGFNYEEGQETSFKRKILIETINNDQIRVQSIVTWQTKNIFFDEDSGGIVAEDHLYNWLGY